MLICAALLLAATTTAVDTASAAPANSERPDALTLPIARLKAAVPRGDGRMPPKGPQLKSGGHNHPGGSSSDGVPGIDSLPNFVDAFTAPGFDDHGNAQSTWPYEMVGASPDRGIASPITAPVIPVVVDLLLPDGSVFLSFDGSDDVQPVLASPIFQPSTTPTGFTQFTDGMMRSHFWDRIRHGNSDDGYHTILIPQPKRTRHMRVPFLRPDGKRAWFVFVDDKGNPVLTALDQDVFVALLFPATVPVDNTTLIGAAELAGDMSTRDLTTLLFDNVVLFEGTLDNCCVLGFHSYDLEPGDAHNGNRERRFVFDFASWLSPGVFSLGFEDITPLSHELAEAFANPFVDNATPWWLVVDPLTGLAICQNNLEVGDVIEVLTSLPVSAVQMNNRTYHPQNVALLPWFEFLSPSPSARRAFTFPDETTLMSLSPAPLLPGCVAAGP